jgi:hypothetical protein
VRRRRGKHAQHHQYNRSQRDLHQWTPTGARKLSEPAGRGRRSQRYSVRYRSSPFSSPATHSVGPRSIAASGPIQFDRAVGEALNNSVVSTPRPTFASQPSAATLRSANGALRRLRRLRRRTPNQRCTHPAGAPRSCANRRVPGRALRTHTRGRRSGHRPRNRRRAEDLGRAGAPSTHRATSGVLARPQIGAGHRRVIALSRTGGRSRLRPHSSEPAEPPRGAATQYDASHSALPLRAETERPACPHERWRRSPSAGTGRHRQ